MTTQVNLNHSLLSFPLPLFQQGNLYAVRWYFNKDEFFSYLPKESPPERIFSVPGVIVDVSSIPVTSIRKSSSHPFSPPTKTHVPSLTYYSHQIIMLIFVCV